MFSNILKDIPMLGVQKNQGSFTDFIITSNLSKKVDNSFLAKIDKIIDFKPIENMLKELYPSSIGRPSFPPLVMFKILLIQQYYNLSDPELEFSVADRISFRRFVGLSFEEAVPDETTMVRFRQRLVAAGFKDKLLNEANSQLERHGLIVRAATIIDATLLESRAKRPKATEEPVDKDASYTTKRGKIHYGYKAHVSVDDEHHLVEKCILTTASVHDSNVFDELIPEDSKAVFADKAYTKEERSANLEKRGIKDGILEKGYRNHPLSEAQIESNKSKMKIRSNIERVFAHWKRWYGYRAVRYKGIAKNELELAMKAMAYNFKRTTAIIMG